MPVPLATTAITVERVVTTTDEDGYDPNAAAPTPLAKHVRATISVPTGAVQLAGGDRVVTTATLHCDPTDLQSQDTVTDEGDGTVWTVLWARQYGAFGLGHTLAQLRLVQGVT